MQWRVSSSLAAITSLFLLLAGDLVVAQVDAPFCTDFESPWEWSFNTLNQNPCLVTAYLMATCYGGAFIVAPLLGVGDSYSSPTKEKIQEANSCWCSTVVFSLISACGECQERLSKSWSQYSRNCTGTIEPSTFPNPVPAGTRVPQWALQDITRANLWNATAARSIGDTPEILPGALIGTSASSSVSSTSSASSSAAASASPVSTISSGSGLNTGAIAGGVGGGVIAIAAIAGLLFWRRRRRAQAPSVASVVKDASPPPSTSQMGQVHPAPSYDQMPGPQRSHVHPAPSYDQMPGPHLTLNDPNDTTTHPRHQGVTTSTPGVQVPVVTYNWYLSGNDPANVQPLRQQGNHGLPTV